MNTPDRPADLLAAKYVSFSSHKRDGDIVSLPVWIVPFDDGFAFTTDADAWKVRRVRRDPRATIAACSARGRVTPGTTVHAGTATVLTGAEARRVRREIARKYPVGSTLLRLVEGLGGLLRRDRGDERIAAIKIVLGQ